jgi:hypothetical protein
MTLNEIENVDKELLAARYEAVIRACSGHSLSNDGLRIPNLDYQRRTGHYQGWQGLDCGARRLLKTVPCRYAANRSKQVRARSYR